jgi:2-keto-3-deoxy-L-rhamnonate aldolase RhmA
MGKLGSSSDITVEDEIRKALQLIIRKNKPAGIIALSNEGGKQRFSQGFDFVAVAHDAHFISKELHSLKSKFSNYLQQI